MIDSELSQQVQDVLRKKHSPVGVRRFNPERQWLLTDGSRVGLDTGKRDNQPHEMDAYDSYYGDDEDKPTFDQYMGFETGDTEGDHHESVSDLSYMANKTIQHRGEPQVVKTTVAPFRQPSGLPGGAVGDMCRKTGVIRVNKLDGFKQPIGAEIHSDPTPAQMKTLESLHHEAEGAGVEARYDIFHPHTGKLLHSLTGYPALHKTVYHPSFPASMSAPQATEKAVGSGRPITSQLEASHGSVWPEEKPAHGQYFLHPSGKLIGPLNGTMHGNALLDAMQNTGREHPYSGKDDRWKGLRNNGSHFSELHEEGTGRVHYGPSEIAFSHHKDRVTPEQIETLKQMQGHREINYDLYGKSAGHEAMPHVEGAVSGSIRHLQAATGNLHKAVDATLKPLTDHMSSKYGAKWPDPATPDGNYFMDHSGKLIGPISTHHSLEVFHAGEATGNAFPSFHKHYDSITAPQLHALHQEGTARVSVHGGGYFTIFSHLRDKVSPGHIQSLAAMTGSNRDVAGLTYDLLDHPGEKDNGHMNLGEGEHDSGMSLRDMKRAIRTRKAVITIVKPQTLQDAVNKSLDAPGLNKPVVKIETLPGGMSEAATPEQKIALHEEFVKQGGYNARTGRMSVLDESGVPYSHVYPHGMGSWVEDGKVHLNPHLSVHFNNEQDARDWGKGIGHALMQTGIGIEMPKKAQHDTVAVHYSAPRPVPLSVMHRLADLTAHAGISPEREHDHKKLTWYLYGEDKPEAGHAAAEHIKSALREVGLPEDGVHVAGANTEYHDSESHPSLGDENPISALHRQVFSVKKRAGMLVFVKAPEVGPGSLPVKSLHDVRDSYVTSSGIGTTAPEVVHYHGGQAKKIADAFDEMKHEPDAPHVKASYDAMKRETKAQYQHLVDNGYKFEPWQQEGQPYADSKEMAHDVHQNKRIKFFPTDAGYGEGNSEEKYPNHPMLESAGVTINGKPLVYNDLLRAVHDVFGHAVHGHQFGAKGEEGAWAHHASMYSKEALPALTAETRGQNSWVNSGKHLRREDGSLPKPTDQDYLHPTARPYADQKAGLLPDWATKPVTEGKGSVQIYPKLQKSTDVVNTVSKSVPEPPPDNAPFHERAAHYLTRFKPGFKDVASILDTSKLAFHRGSHWILPDGNITHHNQSTHSTSALNVMRNMKESMPPGTHDPLRHFLNQTGFVRLNTDNGTASVSMTKHPTPAQAKTVLMVHAASPNHDRMEWELLDRDTGKPLAQGRDMESFERWSSMNTRKMAGIRITRSRNV